MGLSFAVEEKEAFYVAIPANREEALKFVNIFKPLYENPEILKVGQNIKYDYEVLMNYGVEIQGKMFDTMLAHYIIQPELYHNMDYLAEVFLNYQTVHIEELIGPKGKNQKSMRDLAPSEVYEYAAEDADITLRLKNVLEPKLKEIECEDLFWNVEMPLVPVLAHMEMNGVCIDTETLKETSNNLTNRLAEIEHHIYELAGESFNISSPRQVGEILFGKMKIVEKPKKTKTGQYVTSEEVLQQLRSKSPIIDEILNYRGLKKLLGTYIDALPKLINPRTGHIHASFNQAITATGRLSSSDPNLQNIPVRDDDGKEIRRCFIPEPGCLFFSADYSQIELRIMAHLSEDANMVEAFREGSDIHAATAAKIWHEDIKDVTDAQRKKAKTANFGIIYGITTFGLAHLPWRSGLYGEIEGDGKSQGIRRNPLPPPPLSAGYQQQERHCERICRAQCHQCPYPGFRGRHHQGGDGTHLQPLQKRRHQEQDDHSGARRAQLLRLSGRERTGGEDCGRRNAECLQAQRATGGRCRLGQKLA